MAGTNVAGPLPIVSPCMVDVGEHWKRVDLPPGTIAQGCLRSATGDEKEDVSFFRPTPCVFNDRLTEAARASLLGDRTTCQTPRASGEDDEAREPGAISGDSDERQRTSCAPVLYAKSLVRTLSKAEGRVVNPEGVARSAHVSDEGRMPKSMSSDAPLFILPQVVRLHSVLGLISQASSTSLSTSGEVGLRRLVDWLLNVTHALLSLRKESDGQIAPVVSLSSVLITRAGEATLFTGELESVCRLHKASETALGAADCLAGKSARNDLGGMYSATEREQVLSLAMLLREVITNTRSDTDSKNDQKNPREKSDAAQQGSLSHKPQPQSSSSGPASSTPTLSPCNSIDEVEDGVSLLQSIVDACLEDSELIDLEEFQGRLEDLRHTKAYIKDRNTLPENWWQDAVSDESKEEEEEDRVSPKSNPDVTRTSHFSNSDQKRGQAPTPLTKLTPTSGTRLEAAKAHDSLPTKTQGTGKHSLLLGHSSDGKHMFGDIKAKSAEPSFLPGCGSPPTKSIPRQEVPIFGFCTADTKTSASAFRFGVASLPVKSPAGK